jgi:alkylation response protein AidB-like acyl-CoA dehydrogenase
MNLDLDSDQQLVIESVRTLLRRHAGPARARDLDLRHQYDDDLLRALREADLLDLVTADGAGPLEAALVVEEIAAGLGNVYAGARMLVAPFVLTGDVPDRIALVDEAFPGPARFAHQADLVIAIDKAEAKVLSGIDARAKECETIFLYPMGRIDTSGGEALPAGSGDLVRRWWQVALATEIVGLSRTALELTVKYVKERQQFGRALADFQAIQHRLAELFIALEGARWMALFAAWSEARPEDAALAAGYASTVAQKMVLSLHQVTGAIGFTDEYDLHLYSLRLRALCAEMGGARKHYEQAARARWLPAGV